VTFVKETRNLLVFKTYQQSNVGSFQIAFSLLEHWIKNAWNIFI